MEDYKTHFCINCFLSSVMISTVVRFLDLRILFVKDKNCTKEKDEALRVTVSVIFLSWITLEPQHRVLQILFQLRFVTKKHKKILRILNLDGMEPPEQNLAKVFVSSMCWGCLCSWHSCPVFRTPAGRSVYLRRRCRCEGTDFLFLSVSPCCLFVCLSANKLYKT